MDPQRYSELLAKALPVVIDTRDEHERMLAVVSDFMAKGEESLSAEESRLLELMVVLIEQYEDRTLKLPDSSPTEVLRMLMESNGLRQADLLDVFGSRSVASDVYSGKRGISKSQAKKLAERFGVEASLFI